MLSITLVVTVVHCDFFRYLFFFIYFAPPVTFVFFSSSLGNALTLCKNTTKLIDERDHRCSCSRVCLCHWVVFVFRNFRSVICTVKIISCPVLCHRTVAPFGFKKSTVDVIILFTLHCAFMFQRFKISTLAFSSSARRLTLCAFTTYNAKDTCSS